MLTFVAALLDKENRKDGKRVKRSHFNYTLIAELFSDMLANPHFAGRFYFSLDWIIFCPLDTHVPYFYEYIFIFDR